MGCVLLGPTGERIGAGLSRHSLRWGHSRVVYSGMGTCLCPHREATCLHSSAHLAVSSAQHHAFNHRFLPAAIVQLFRLGILAGSSVVLCLGCNSESEMLRRTGCGTSCHRSAPAEVAQPHDLHSPASLLTPTEPVCPQQPACFQHPRLGSTYRPCLLLEREKCHRTRFWFRAFSVLVCPNQPLWLLSREHWGVCG